MIYNIFSCYPFHITWAMKYHTFAILCGIKLDNPAPVNILGHRI